MRSWFPILALALSATLGVPFGASAGSTRAGRASALYASATRRLAAGTPAERQLAMAELEDASNLDPARPDIALALGGLYLDAHLAHRARGVAKRMVAADSANADAWLLLARCWKWDWLATIDEESRDRAIVCAARSAHLAPGRPEAWALLAPMLTDADELEPAHDVAVFAARATPTDARLQALLAGAAQRLGDLATAEGLFDVALPRLPAAERERYEDIAPLLPPWSVEAYRTLPPPARAKYVERFWSDNDPDPISPENEARLEYWARVAQAISLYGTSRPGEWDMRAQYYVRFGRPDYQELNPIYKPESLRQGDWLVWGYPDLGLRIWIGGASSVFGFPEVISSTAATAFVPRDSLARRGELTPLSAGWAVFHRLPPGVTPLDTRLALSRFRTDAGTSLFAQAEAPGGFEDRLTSQWLVLDSTSAAVVREERPMGASACEPERARAASFTTPLPPGRYTLAVQVEDEGGGRGTVRRGMFVSPSEGDLALSDLVVTCSPPERSVVAGSSVRLEPETGLFPAGGDQLNAYFEIYHLAPSGSGDARFVYDCSVRTAVRDRRGWLSRTLAPRNEPPAIHVTRAETTQGPLRRQFLSIPVGSLPAGSYEVEVLVRDLTNGLEAKTATTFERKP